MDERLAAVSARATARRRSRTQARSACLQSIACALLPIILSATGACREAPAASGTAGQGRALFDDACGPCHDPSGGGGPGRGPSLRDSVYLAAAPDALIRIVLDGFRSDDPERSARFVLPMSSFRILGDEEVAAIVTFVAGAWGPEATPVTAADVAAVRSATSNRLRPWTPPELRNHLPAGSAR